MSHSPIPIPSGLKGMTIAGIDPSSLKNDHMSPVPVFSDYLVKLIIPASRAISFFLSLENNCFSVSTCFTFEKFPPPLLWLFFQNVIQLQPHGSKNHIVLYQEMRLQI